jgi:uncharacterized protein YjiS (DUF1127 family)
MLNLIESAPAISLAPSSPPSTITRLATKAAGSVAGWAEKRRQLRALSELDDHLLQDIGLSHDDVVHACSRPFWALKTVLTQRPAAR